MERFKEFIRNLRINLKKLTTGEIMLFIGLFIIILLLGWMYYKMKDCNFFGGIYGICG